MDLYTAIITASISTTVTVVGWLVIDRQNRKLRKEDAKRRIYDQLLSTTTNLSSKLSLLNAKIIKDINRLEQIFVESQKESDNKNQLINDWHNIVINILDSIYDNCVSIDNYLVFLKFGGTGINENVPIYQGLKSVRIDTINALYSITNKWINYINLIDVANKEIQIKALKEESEKDLKNLEEFNNCLTDVVVYLYNTYLARTLKMQEQKIDFIQNRRYVTENGLVDKRIMN